MTTRCYEELQAKLENQQQQPLLSRETTLCTTTSPIVYYEKSKLPDGLQLPTISNWSDFNDALTNVNTRLNTAITKAENDIETQQQKVSDAEAERDAAQLAYYQIVASDTSSILTEDFVVPDDYVPSNDAITANNLLLTKESLLLFANVLLNSVIFIDLVYQL